MRTAPWVGIGVLFGVLAFGVGRFGIEGASLPLLAVVLVLAAANILVTVRRRAPWTPPPPPQYVFGPTDPRSLEKMYLEKMAAADRVQGHRQLVAMRRARYLASIYGEGEGDRGSHAPDPFEEHTRARVDHTDRAAFHARIAQGHARIADLDRQAAERATGLEQARAKRFAEAANDAADHDTDPS